jgi:hypothetical protein
MYVFSKLCSKNLPENIGLEKEELEGRQTVVCDPYIGNKGEQCVHNVAQDPSGVPPSYKVITHNGAAHD